MTRVLPIALAALALGLYGSPALGQQEIQQQPRPMSGAPSQGQAQTAPDPMPGTSRQTPKPPTASETRPDASGSSEAAAPHARQYVVKKGDTLRSIARETLGSADRWHTIARANGIQDPKDLRVGQRLTINTERSGS